MIKKSLILSVASWVRIPHVIISMVRWPKIGEASIKHDRREVNWSKTTLTNGEKNYHISIALSSWAQSMMTQD